MKRNEKKWKEMKRNEKKWKPRSPCFAMGPEWILRMSMRACSLGRGISTFLSKRPGRIKAGSRTSGLLVAMMILTLPSSLNPSIWLRSFDEKMGEQITIIFQIKSERDTSIKVLWTSRSDDWPSESRFPPIASISSMKMTQGSWSFA